MSIKKERSLMDLKFFSYDYETLELAVKTIITKLKDTGENFVIYGPIPMPTKKRRVTVLRAPQFYKKSMEHYARKHHVRLLRVYISDKSTKISPILNDLGDVMPAGVKMSIGRIEG